MNLRNLVAALAVAALTSPAYATWAEASLSNVSFTVIDLRPADGHDPGFTFDTGVGWTSVGALLHPQGRPAIVDRFKDTGWLVPGAASVTRGFASAEAAATVDGLMVGGQAPSEKESVWFSTRADLYGNSTGPVLAAHTALTISFDALLRSASGAECRHSECEFSAASASLRGYDENLVKLMEDELEVRSSAGPTGYYDEEVGELSITFYNRSARAKRFYLEVSTAAWGFAPVPEPSSSAAMAAGLAALVALGRRRAKAADR